MAETSARVSGDGTEHVDLCPYDGTAASSDCPFCVEARKACWTTPKGKAFHLRRDCGALDWRRQHEPVRTTVLWAKGSGYLGCEVCVNEVCGACAGGHHERCSPRSSKLPHCACAARNHHR